MRTLALETSTGCGSVALLDQDAVVYAAALPQERRTAQTLVPAMDQALRYCDWPATSVDLVALTNGPGSFTGLRIAVTCAKTFAYCARTDLIAIPTLDVVVEQLPEQVTTACAVLDAQRGQLFAAVYRRGPDQRWETVQPCRIVHRDQLAELLPAGALLTGPGLARLEDPGRPLRDGWASESLWVPRAATVGQMAYRLYRAGRRDDPLTVKPEYHRPSYAEPSG